MPVGNHSEQSTGGSAKKSQEKQQGFRDSSLVLFGPVFVESEGKKGNQRGNDEKVLHVGQR